MAGLVRQQRKRGDGMNSLEIMLALIFAGFVLLLTGYSRRDDKSGIFMLAMGILVMFGTVAYKLYLELG